MDNFGYIRATSIVPKTSVANVQDNLESVISQAEEANNKNTDIAVFPELCITGYSCGDLFRQTLLIDEAEKAIERLCKESARWDMLIIAGSPVRWKECLYNCGIAIHKGRIAGIVPKTYLPNYNEFYEKRWFVSGLNVANETIEYANQEVPFGTDLIFVHAGSKIAIEICEDLWATVPPSSVAALNGATIIANLSASNELIGKHKYLCELISQQSARCRAAYIYASAGYGESSTDVVYSGNAIIAEDGKIIASSPRFTQNVLMTTADIDLEILRNERQNTDSFSDGMSRHRSQFREIRCGLTKHNCISNLKRNINPHPFVPADNDRLNQHCSEIINIQTEGLMRRLDVTRCKKLVVGVSGGLDSTLALLVAANAFDKLNIDRKGIIGITMPGFGTTDRTYDNALTLINQLGATLREINICDAVKQHFKDIEHDINIHDVTYENSQARERTQILMDFANKVGGMVLGTGDLSELALGWCTYNGDHISMYGVNAGIPKTLVRHLVKWFASTSENRQLQNALNDIIDTPISPELIPADSQGKITQKTEDLVGPYKLHDFFLYNVLRYGFSPAKVYFLAQQAFKGEYEDEIIRHWLKTFFRRFFNQQFKRSCMPDGPKVGSVCLSPRGDWRMPSDASASLWLAECEKL